MPRYEFACDACACSWDVERPMSEASDHAHCPVCEAPGRRVYVTPKFLFKADPRDVRPVWHKHDGYAHAHAPRRGRHRNPSEDH
ncbi:MAG: hypothetical protein KF883_08705 [Thermomicrobiales bacterium]|nr:hypothetical protein [Thermomicrobiales bacterium]